MMDQNEKLKQIKQGLLKRWRQQDVLDPLPNVDTSKIPCSDEQKSIWFHEVKEGRTLYSMPIAYEINVKLEPAMVKNAAQILVDRYEILRTHFVEEAGEIYQNIANEMSVQFCMKDLSHEPHLLTNCLEAIAKESFDLSHDHLFRVYFFILSEQKSVLLFHFHHIIADGWSLKVITTQFIELYNALQSIHVQQATNPLFHLESSIQESQKIQHETPRYQYKNYTAWAQQNKAAKAKHEIFWQTYLAETPMLHLQGQVPCDRPPLFNFKGKKGVFIVPVDVQQSLEQAISNSNYSIFVYGLTAFQLLLSIYSNQDDFNIGFPIANRQHHLTETMIGYFVNTLVFRSRLDWDTTLAELLLTNHQQLLRLYEHGEYPFIELVNQLNIRRSAAIPPIFQTMFIYQDLSTKHDDSLDMDFLDVDSSTALFDLLLNLYHCNSGLKMSFTYYEPVFNKHDIERYVQDYFKILSALCLSMQQNKQLSGFLQSFPVKQLQVYWNVNAYSTHHISTLLTTFLNHGLNLPIRIEPPNTDCNNAQYLSLASLKRNSIYFIYVDIQNEQTLVDFESLVASLSNDLTLIQSQLIHVFIFFQLSCFTQASFFQDASAQLSSIASRTMQQCTQDRPGLTFIEWSAESINTETSEKELVKSWIHQVINGIDPTIRHIFIDLSSFIPSSLSPSMFSQFLFMIQNEFSIQRLQWVVCNAPGDFHLDVDTQLFQGFHHPQGIDTRSLDGLANLSFFLQCSIEECLSSYQNRLTPEDVIIVISKDTPFLQIPCPLLCFLPPEDWMSMMHWLSSFWFVPGRNASDFNARWRQPIDFSVSLYSEVNRFELPGLVEQYDTLAADVYQMFSTQISHEAIPASLSETESKLLALVKEVMGVKQARLSDNFFQIGGHSLMAVQLIDLIRRTFKIDLTLRDFFKQINFSALVLAIDSAPKQRLDVKEPIHILPEQIPLSFTQNRIWFLDQLSVNRQAYNMPFMIRIDGYLDEIILIKSIEHLISKHDIFRTQFIAGSGGVYQHIDNHMPIEAARFIWLHRFQQNQQLQLDTLVQIEVNFHFNLSSGHLIRFHLVQFSAVKYFLIMNVHHIIADGYTITLIMDELSDGYTRLLAGQDLIMPNPQRKQYAHYCIEQQTKQIDNQTEYWLNYLDGHLPLELVTDYPRPPVRQNHGAYEKFFLPAQTLARLKQFLHQEQSSLFAGLLSIFVLLMKVFSGQNDVVVGIPAVNRLEKETQSMMGVFLNIFAMRQYVSGDMSYQQLLVATNESVRGAYDHPDVPFEVLVDKLKISRDLSQNPLVQVMFNFINIEKPNLKLPFLKTSFLEVTRNSSKFDLDFFVEEVGGNLVGILEYNTDIFSPYKVQQMVACYTYLLEALLEQPINSLSSILSQYATQESIQYQTQFVGNLDKPTSQKNAFSASRLISKFELSARSYPNKKVLCTAEHSLNYYQLYHQVVHLAEHIHSLTGRVGLMIADPVHMIVAMFAVLSVGRAFVVMDTEASNEIVNEIAESAEIVFVITDQAAVLENKVFTTQFEVESFATLLTKPTLQVLLPIVQEDAEAYVLFTSGSTGRPKGVIQSHQNLFDHIQRYAQSILLSDTDVILQVAQHGTDAGLMDTYVALLNGATLLQLDLRTISIEALFKHICQAGVTILHMTPTVFLFLFKFTPKSFSVEHQIRAVVFGGEEVTKEVMSMYYSFFSESCLFVNGFGPTECTTALQYQLRGAQFDFKQWPSVPIGRPLPDVKIKLIDAQQHDTYFFGEMVIASKNIALSYLGDPTLNATKFMVDASGERWYKTGDLAYITQYGYYIYNGRVDSQVKIRGFRVELLAIEALFTESSMINDAVVVLTTLDGVMYLVAYLVVTVSYDEAKLRTFLKSKLPDYAIPQYFVVMDELPRTRTGKKDRQTLIQLKNWQQLATNHSQTLSNNLSDLEQMLQQAWQKVLGHPCQSADQNFFDAGGHSLLFLVLFQEIRSQRKESFQLIDLYRYPTVRSFAAFLTNDTTTTEDYTSLAAQRAMKRAIRKKKMTAPLS